MNAMLASDLPLPKIGRGKVRDIYALGGDRLLLLTTDRISAFDVVMAETIPMKGAVLTQISAFWFNELEGVVPHHMISADADEIIRQVPALKDHRADLLAPEPRAAHDDVRRELARVGHHAGDAARVLGDAGDAHRPVEHGSAARGTPG